MISLILAAHIMTNQAAAPVAVENARIIIAHRGASADRTELTREAFEEALHQQAEGFEWDLR